MSGVTKYLLHSQEHKYREKNLDCEDCKIEMEKGNERVMREKNTS
jgi:hypothetical protein